MAINKNQHFVPRCYLRPFTVDGKNAAINLYNIDRKRFIPLAPVKNQCSQDYFYGQDEYLEENIQSIEREYGTALCEILKPTYILTDEHRAFIKKFWIFQNLRTEKSAIKSAEIAGAINQGSGYQVFQDEIKDQSVINILTFVDSMCIVDDLRACIVRNRTELPFFTSDNPAVLTNRWWFTDKRTRYLSFGPNSAGTIILLPISPKLLFLGYDGDVYSIKHNQGMVDARNERDIESFNQHQILNCRNNLFIHDEKYCTVIEKSFMIAAKNRLKNSNIINYAVYDHTTDRGSQFFRAVDQDEFRKHSDGLIHVQSAHPIPLSWPSLIARRTNGKIYTNGTGRKYIRRNGATGHFYKELAYPSIR